MPIYNSEIAEKFRTIADLLELKGGNQFRVRAYRGAARTIERESKSIEKMVKEGKDLTKYKGIGEDLASQIEDIIKTGESTRLQNLKKKIPETLTAILDIEGVGPKRGQKLYQELDVKTVSDLQDALEEGKVQDLEGFGEKTAQNIKAALKEYQGEKRTSLRNAEEVVKPLREYLESSEHAIKVTVAGSYRRKKETVGDIDVLVTSSNNQKIMDRFTNYSDVREVVSKGETKSTIKLRVGMQVDLRVVKDESYGAALLYFTGSKSHNIGLRDLALDRNWKVNEYGVFDENEERIAGETEKAVYETLDLDFIEPELRENRGEIEAAKKGDLPELLELKDIRGDLQMHSTHSDGKNSVEVMAKRAKEMGREYIAITDHSSYIGITQGLEESDVDDYIQEIREINEKFDGIEILAGVEVDILEDGSLDLSDESLNKFDIVFCSVHSKFDLDVDEQTERIIKALEHPHTNVLAHPTGRKIQERRGEKFHLEEVLEAAKENNCWLEINALPLRLDLDDTQIKAAKEKGVKMVISTDAHSKQELDYMRYGVNQARRGWAEKEDIINTRSFRELRNVLDKNG